MSSPTRVLFMQSQSYFGSDSMIHSLLMRAFDRDRIEVHAAVNVGDREQPSAALRALRTIPGLRVRQTRFGPTFYALSRQEQLLSIVHGAPAVADLAVLVAYAKRHRIQIVHGTEKPRDALYGVLLAKAIGARSVVHLHVKAEGWISAKVRWAMRHADAIVGVSRFVADSAVAMGFAPHKVHYVVNGLDASRWDPATDGGRVRAEFGIGPDAPLLAIISRLFHWKGHAALLRALAAIKDQAPDAKLLIVGEDDPRGAPGHGSFTAELKELTRGLGLEGRVIFTGFRTDIANLLAACDVFAMPTFEEPCAVAFLEAMAMRKPIVALESGGTVELVDHGKAGLLSKPGDIDALANNILTLARDAELRVRMGAYARARVEEYYTPARMAAECERIYARMLAQQGPRRAACSTDTDSNSA